MSYILKWFVENTNIQVNDALSVKESSIDDPRSGLGLFIDRTKLKLKGKEKRDTVELLRIPKTSTIGLYHMKSVLHDRSQYSSEEAMQRTQQRIKRAINDFLKLEHINHIATESVILVVELLIFFLLKDDYEIPKVLDYYMDNVLLKSEVNSIILCDDPNLHIYECMFPCKQFESMFELLNSFFTESVPEKPCSVAMIRQMFVATKSRTLEIPQQIDPESEDFTTETTLVPVLDFANHNNSLQNAYFDVDRKTEDVLLLLDVPKCNKLQKSREFEVLISYAPVEDLMHFSTTYGFVPQTYDGTQYINISLDRDYLKMKPFLNVNLRIFYKWLAINPVIQVICYGDKWYINDSGSRFSSILLPFMRLKEKPETSCWDYDSQSYRTFTFFQMFQENDTNEQQALLGSYATKISNLESDDRDFIDLPPLAWTMSFQDDNDEVFRGSFTLEEALELAPFHEPEIFEDAISSFSGYFIEYLENRLETLLRTKDVTDSDSSLMNLIESEIYIIEDLIKDHTLPFWTDLKPESQEHPILYSVPPLCDIDTSSPLFSRYSSNEPDMPQLGSLTLEDFDPTERTDFLMEELKKYQGFYK